MITAALLGPYAPRLACALEPDIEPVATTAPREAFNAACAALASNQVARVLTAKRKSQSATEYCASGPGRLTPALLTRPSSPPKRSTALATTFPGASAVAMSP